MEAEMKFTPVQTLEDLETLDVRDIIEGYYEGFKGEPEPGHNRGRAFWHGWRNGAMDRGHIESDAPARRLAAQYLDAQRAPTPPQ